MFISILPIILCGILTRQRTGRWRVSFVISG